MTRFPVAGTPLRRPGKIHRIDRMRLLQFSLYRPGRRAKQGVEILVVANPVFPVSALPDAALAP
jgi:hypothetical protein